MKKFILVIILASIVYSNSLGRLYFEGNCITCHYENRSISAPSIQDVVTTYKNEYKSKLEFQHKMTQWILNPDDKTALMQKDITKYELMPKLAYDEYTLNEIALYLYDNF